MPGRRDTPGNPEGPHRAAHCALPFPGMDHDRVIKDRQAAVRKHPDHLRARDRALAALYLDRGTENGGDLSHRDIAARYDLSPTTVRNAVNRYSAELRAEADNLRATG